MSDQVERVYMQDESSHRWHVALIEGESEPRVFDACNIQGARDYYHELPEDIDARMFCARCFGSEATAP